MIKYSDEIENHIEKVKQQKIIDENEIKRVEKEKLRKELGDDYFSSESEDNIYARAGDLSGDVTSHNLSVDSRPNERIKKAEEMLMKEDKDADDTSLDGEAFVESVKEVKTFNPLLEFVKCLEKNNLTFKINIRK